AVAKHGDPLPAATIESIKQTQLALKAPLATPSGGGYRSVNVTLRQHFDLYANVRPARTMPGVPARFTGVDLVIVREKPRTSTPASSTTSIRAAPPPSRSP